MSGGFPFQLTLSNFAFFLRVYFVFRTSRKRIFKLIKLSSINRVSSGVDKGGLSPSNELKDHPCERMKSEEKLRGGGDDYV